VSSGVPHLLAQLHHPPPLSPGEVHVWQLRLEDDLQEFAGAAVLDAAERRRAAAFRFPADRVSYQAAHAALRWLLAGYGVGPAASIRFEVGPAGKPRLATGQARPLEFNLAHTRGMVALAFAEAAIGVDVERLRPIPDAEALVLRHFAPEERHAWQLAPADLLCQAFLNGWTRKEAFLKATGEGLQRPLDSFAVTLAPGEPVRLLRADGAGQRLRDWTLVDVTINPAFVGAIAVRADAVRLQNHLLGLPEDR
jgi:4'-phosphopantetheinyl transferase